ncbi:MAG: hypothetical protein ACR2OI_09035, partial [Acidimicrobiia bacterium]
LGLARTIAEREGAGEVAASIANLADGTQEAVDAMRAVAHGIYPPLLEAEGLEPALATIRRSAAIAVELNASGLGRFSRQIEECIYFCVQEIINQATMAGATEARISLDAGAEEVALTAAYPTPAGATVMTAVGDRVEAAEGVLTVTSKDAGTQVDVSLPARRLEPA